MSFSKKERQEIWNKSGGICWYCGCQLPEKGWHADHFIPVIRITKRESLGGFKWKNVVVGIENPEMDTIENTVPSCAPCNLFKSVWDVEFFRFELEAQIERARKGSVNFRNAERFGLITINEPKVTFWFEATGCP